MGEEEEEKKEGEEVEEEKEGEEEEFKEEEGELDRAASLSSRAREVGDSL